jgi:hypothetical protein
MNSIPCPSYVPPESGLEQPAEVQEATHIPCPSYVPPEPGLEQQKYKKQRISHRYLLHKVDLSLVGMKVAMADMVGRTCSGCGQFGGHAGGRGSTNTLNGVDVSDQTCEQMFLIKLVVSVMMNGKDCASTVVIMGKTAPQQ